MTFRLLHLHHYPIYEQLLLEEALLRSDTGNWCLINQGSPDAIVMGISGKPHELIDHTKIAHAQIPLIRRFSGGGTVVVDQNTLFVTFICDKALHNFPAYPEPIMRWTESLYVQALPTLLLKENDFVIGEKKCGGNAQYIKKQKWLHHTSLLWDYDEEKMNYLLHPKKTPAYRQDRPHADFLCRLKQHIETQDTFIQGIIGALQSRYSVVPTSLEEARTLTPQGTRLSTTLLK